MAKATSEEIMQEVHKFMSEGVDITISRKNAVMLFGSVIAANVATVFALAGITAVAKRFVTKTEEVVEEPTLGEKTADLLERGAQHLRKVD